MGIENLPGFEGTIPPGHYKIVNPKAATRHPRNGLGLGDSVEVFESNPEGTRCKISGGRIIGVNTKVAFRWLNVDFQLEPYLENMIAKGTNATGVLALIGDEYKDNPRVAHLMQLLSARDKAIEDSKSDSLFT